MLERDLQNYLFENPEVLFPNQIINRKQREVCIEGRRIDLLFEVDGTQYIVELKRDTIKREDIGQIFEYYGLMRQSNGGAKFKMILAAPSIPSYRRIPLEEFGIRCVEVSTDRASFRQQANILKDAVQQQDPDLESAEDVKRIRFRDLVPPVNSSSFQLSKRILRDGIASVQSDFSEYEVIIPRKMGNSHSADVFCFPDGELSPKAQFIGGGAWWAFSFGQSESMPKNDVPNISVAALPWGLDFTINAELQTSQNVMRERISRSPGQFDKIVCEHGNLEFQAWLKLEHQPRFYHWILLARRLQGTWNSKEIIELYRESEADFVATRNRWIEWVKNQRPELTPRQSDHLERTNKRLNLALRLVRSLNEGDPVWDLSYKHQIAQFADEYRRLKPLLGFFQ